MRLTLALIVLASSVSGAAAARHRPVCVSVDVEGILVRICPPARRR